jgi:regulator of protease activity HflC (stomatin/prohibitin superfamily)
MQIVKRLQVKKDERGLLYKDGDFEAILRPGSYTRLDPFDRYRLETQPLILPCLRNERLTEYLLANAPETVAEHFVPMVTGEHEAGLRYENEVLVEVLPPGSRRLYWKDGFSQRLEKIDLRQSGPRLDDALAETLFRATLASKLTGDDDKIIYMEVVEEGYVGLLKINGKLEAVLQPGVSGWWKFGRLIEVQKFDLRLQTLEVSGQEILTRDKVSLRLNLAANWRYTDPQRAHEVLKQPGDYLYRELQFGLRAAVGTRTLDELLENKQVIDDVVGQHVREKLQGTGIEVASVGLKDIILPGEMKALLAQVVEAEKAAQANVIRRREETAATRSLLNTAKVMEDNPTALRLKELETLERVAERIDRISVFGGLDQVLNGLVKINVPNAGNEK